MLLEDIYKEFDSSNGDHGAYYSLALYQCLCLIDICCANEDRSFSQLNELLEKYSLIFSDNYVFGILAVVTNLKLGIFIGEIQLL